MEAHGHARAGESAACATALSAAEVALDQADRSSDPDWIGYFDEAYLSAKFGHCLRELGDQPQAIRFAERSLQMSEGYERGRVFNLTLLAHSHANREISAKPARSVSRPSQPSPACSPSAWCNTKRFPPDTDTSTRCCRSRRPRRGARARSQRGVAATFALNWLSATTDAAPRISPLLIKSKASASGTHRTSTASLMSISPPVGVQSNAA